MTDAENLTDAQKLRKALRRYTRETCNKKWFEWELRIGVLRGLIMSMERKIKHAEKQQVKWSKRWREADK